MIEFRTIDRNNFRDIIKLSVAESQKLFVAPNVYSLAQAKVQPECVPLAIYSGDTPVGFVMYGLDEEDREYWICRLMVDEKYQNKGYGREAMGLVLALIEADTNHSKVYISFELENTPAQRLYESFGFRPDGRVIDGELVYVRCRESR